MYRKVKRISAAIISLIMLVSCQKPPENEYLKFQSTFMDVFDTYSIIVGYAETEEEFNSYSTVIYEKLKDLHRQFDIYYDYEGVNNLKTINDKAGIESVVVSQDIIDLIKFCKQAYSDTDGVVNIAMGSVLRIWHDYRTRGIDNPENAKLPPMELLREAAGLTDIDDVIVDESKSTVYLAKKGMSLDVGAIAKGFATQIAVNEAKKAGMTSALANIGGNVCSVGKPLDGVRARWGVGIQDPKLQIGNTQNVIDTVFVNDASIVTSGNYQRYYEVDGKMYNHIIDKDTLMPANRVESVTVVCEDSAIADMLSTSLYILPVEQGKKLLQKFNGEAMWIHFDHSIEASDGYKKISKELGGYGATD